MSKVIWCTGAGQGIGRSLAYRLARDGHHVAVSARSESDLASLAETTESFDGCAIPFALDITDEQAVFRVVDEITKRLGDIDLVILNAGTHIPLSAASFSTEPFRALVETNIMGTVHCLSAVLPRFVERRGGHIAVVSSVAGYRGLPTSAAYGATKAALINMCEALKPDLDQYGVRLSLINPGFVRTPLTDKNPFQMPFLMDPDKAADRIVRGLASKRFEITFPKRFTWVLKGLRCVPYALYFYLVRNLVPKQ